MYVLLQITLVSLICWLLIKVLKKAHPQVILRIINSSVLLCLLIPVLGMLDLSLQFQTYTETEVAIKGMSTDRLQRWTSEQPIKTDMTEKHLSPDHGYTMDTTLQVVWVIGMFLALLRHLKGIIHVRHMVKTSKHIECSISMDQRIAKRVQIRQHAQAKIPFLYVSGNIFIMLPTHAVNWHYSHLRNVILHELCHYRRKDHWLIWLSLVASVIYWFHPLIKILLIKKRQYIELSCDQQLLAEGLDKHNYAETLMFVTRDFKLNQSVIGMATEPHLLSTRIHSIITEPSRSISLMHRCLIVACMTSVLITGCFRINQADTLELSDMVELISHELPLLRNEKLPKGDIHLSAFYDGYNNQNTYFELQLKDSHGQEKWVRLGPLKKFTEHIPTWHLRLTKGVELTGQYRVVGVEPDGMVDGVAIGLVSLSHAGEYQILKSQGPIEGEVPNVLCSWPLWMGEKKFNQVLPQMTDSSPESVQRLLCGSQLMGNGIHSF
ncbi:MAG: M56 family metallopeptidase [Xanthomonadales bacterium]|nr:M56 family metallopeptidase [Xanthomonadales bacterium]